MLDIVAFEGMKLKIDGKFVIAVDGFGDGCNKCAIEPYLDEGEECFIDCNKYVFKAPYLADIKEIIIECPDCGEIINVESINSFQCPSCTTFIEPKIERD
jgi:hypothetical protein